MLVEMLHVPAPVHAPIQFQHQLDIRRRNPFRRRLAEPAVEEALRPVFLETPPIAPELSLRHPQQLAGLHHRQLARLPAAQYIPKLLHPAVL
jgi:hypothetical protein